MNSFTAGIILAMEKQAMIHVPGTLGGMIGVGVNQAKRSAGARLADWFEKKVAAEMVQMEKNIARQEEIAMKLKSLGDKFPAIKNIFG